MFKLKKIMPPFGTRESPIYESSYSEGLIKVVDGMCIVHLDETRQRLLKLGYMDMTACGIDANKTSQENKNKKKKR